jgi:ABC-type nitrate/sulfonate/bicarbonate transport system substrate-binding protein
MVSSLPLLLLLAAAVLLHMPNSSVQAAEEELTRIRLGLEWFLNADHLPLVIALREGYFREAGLDVVIVEPSDHWEAEQEIIAGRLDVAVTETLHLARDASAGKPVLGFGRFLHTDGGVMYLESSGIRRPRDMCGANITYPGSPGPGGPAIVQTMVEADGGTCDTSSYGKYNGGFYHTRSLESGDADVATLVFYNFEVVEANIRGLRASFFSLKDWGVPDFCQLVLFSTPERVGELGPELRRLVLAVRRATGLIHRDPKRARSIFAEYVREKARQPPLPPHLPSAGGGIGARLRRAAAAVGPLAALRRFRSARIADATMTATLPAFPNDNSISSDYFDGLMRWLVRTGQVDEVAAQGTPPSVYWTNDLAL